MSFSLESWRHARSPDARQSFGEMMRKFPRWLGSLKSSPLADRQPWMTYTAIEFLRQKVRPDMSVFEWGSGGSTLFFASRVANLVTVEHERLWAERVQEVMSAGHPASWRMEMIEAEPRPSGVTDDPADPCSYASAVAPWVGQSFESYVKTVDEYPDSGFDWVIVDGRSRPSCMMHGIPKVKPGGYLILDDAARERYGWVYREMARLGWDCFSFAGPVPYTMPFGSTTAWRRPTASSLES